jgi:hypothetical protein
MSALPVAVVGEDERDADVSFCVHADKGYKPLKGDSSGNA